MAHKLNSPLREAESRIERGKIKYREQSKRKMEERKESDPTGDASNSSQEVHQRCIRRQNTKEEVQIRHRDNH